MSTSLQLLIQKGIQEWTSISPSPFQSIRYVTQEQDGIQMVIWKYESSIPVYTSFFIKTYSVDSDECPYHFKKPVYVTNSIQDFIDFLGYQVRKNWTYVGSCILPALDTPALEQSVYKSIVVYFQLDDEVALNDESKDHLSCRFVSAV
jgi:hypothetical protein